MIVPSMTQKEIAKHLLSEVSNNRSRIATKVMTVAKQMRRVGKKVYACQQTVGSNTKLTIYIYGIDKKGFLYAPGCWYQSEKGLCWVTVGASDDANFYLAHFFHRYAERILKNKMTAMESVLEFYRNYQVAAVLSTKIREDGLHEIQCPMPGGLALGVRITDRILVYNTCVSDNLLWQDQVNTIEDDRELNETIQSMDYHKYKQFVEAIRGNL
jgi:hypothetical protein